MANILIGGFEASVAQQLARILRGRRHHVCVYESISDACEAVAKRRVDADLLILEVSRSQYDFLALVERTDQELGEQDRMPRLLCVTAINRGPRFELELERRGARLVYVG